MDKKIDDDMNNDDEKKTVIDENDSPPKSNDEMDTSSTIKSTDLAEIVKKLRGSTLMEYPGKWNENDKKPSSNGSTCKADFDKRLDESIGEVMRNVATGNLQGYTTVTGMIKAHQLALEQLGGNGNPTVSTHDVARSVLRNAIKDVHRAAKLPTRFPVTVPNQVPPLKLDPKLFNLFPNIRNNPPKVIGKRSATNNLSCPHRYRREVFIRLRNASNPQQPRRRPFTHQDIMVARRNFRKLSLLRNPNVVLTPRVPRNRLFRPVIIPRSVFNNGVPRNIYGLHNQFVQYPSVPPHICNNYPNQQFTRTFCDKNNNNQQVSYKDIKKEIKKEVPDEMEDVEYSHHPVKKEKEDEEES